MFDGHLSHISAYNHIIILKFPSHVTDVLQLLDVVCFGQLKREWERRLHERISKYGIKQPLTKPEFVNELCAIWNTGMKRDSVISGFEAIGTVLNIFNVICVYYISTKILITYKQLIL